MSRILIIDDPIVDDKTLSAEEVKQQREACRKWYDDAVARGFIKPSEVSNIWHLGDLYNIRAEKDIS